MALDKAATGPQEQTAPSISLAFRQSAGTSWPASVERRWSSCGNYYFYLVEHALQFCCRERAFGLAIRKYFRQQIILWAAWKRGSCEKSIFEVKSAAHIVYVNYIIQSSHLKGRVERKNLLIPSTTALICFWDCSPILLQFSQCTESSLLLLFCLLLGTAQQWTEPWLFVGIWWNFCKSTTMINTCINTGGWFTHSQTLKENTCLIPTLYYHFYSDICNYIVTD